MNTEEHKSIDWRPITNRFYSKRKIYSMGWDVNLKLSLVVGAPFGGPIAVTRRQDKFARINEQPTIDIYTSSGVPITSFLVSKIFFIFTQFLIFSLQVGKWTNFKNGLEL